MARTLLYEGYHGLPLYRLDSCGGVLTDPDTPPSFFREYNGKLRAIADQLHTPRAKELAAGRQNIANAFYDALLNEVSGCYERGRTFLENLIDSN